ncbi:MAG: hypothetical protein R3C26_14135 [Calditrichia bacterium]
MKHMFWLTVAFTFTLIVSCDNLTDNEKTQKELLGRIWQLQSLETIDGDKIDVPEGPILHPANSRRRLVWRHIRLQRRMAEK